MKSSEMKLSEILNLDVKSEEFWEAYKAISDKYWTFENPDDGQLAAKTLVMWAERYDMDKVILCHKIIEQIMKLDGKNKGPVSGNLVFADTNFFFDIYETEVQKDKLQGMLGKAQQAMESGNIEIKNKGKKGPFSNKFYKK